MSDDRAKSKKEGFVKTPRQVEINLWGPDSPLPEKWRVFYFIKYRIQDNKRKSESESMKREYIIRMTGIWENHFSRIIRSLSIEDDLIEVEKGSYRDSAATYRLSRTRFPDSVIVPDQEKATHQNGGSEESEKTENTKMVSEKEAKHQNGGSKNQNGVETVVTTTKSLSVPPSRSLSPKAPEHPNLKTPATGCIEESFTLLGTGTEAEEAEAARKVRTELQRRYRYAKRKREINE